jgi:hypothetical protein
MIVRVLYNEYGSDGRKLADDVVKTLETDFAADRLIIMVRSIPLATDEDRVWVEVAIDFPRSNVDAANDLVSRISAVGIEARTFHDND